MSNDQLLCPQNEEESKKKWHACCTKIFKAWHKEKKKIEKEEAKIKGSCEIFIKCRWDENQMNSSSSKDDGSNDNGDKKPATKKTDDSNRDHLESEDSKESKDSKESEESKDEEESEDNEEENEEEEQND